MTSTYQCDTIHLQRVTDRENRMIADMVGGEGATLEIDKTMDELYIMNNEGKTIDTYRWPELVGMVPENQ